jgi:hypothetical protein
MLANWAIGRIGFHTSLRPFFLKREDLEDEPIYLPLKGKKWK